MMMKIYWYPRIALAYTMGTSSRRFSHLGKVLGIRDAPALVMSLDPIDIFGINARPSGTMSLLRIHYPKAQSLGSRNSRGSPLLSLRLTLLIPGLLY